MQFVVRAEPRKKGVFHKMVGEFELNYGSNTVERIPIEAGYLCISGGRLVTASPCTVGVHELSQIQLKFLPHVFSDQPFTLSLKNTEDQPGVKILRLSKKIRAG
jgi:hypothetical protein